MGLMMGKVEGDTMIVMDSFALPVEGTETRVNAATEGKSRSSCCFWLTVYRLRIHGRILESHQAGNYRLSK
jgi:hypothetical protein